MKTFEILFVDFQKLETILAKTEERKTEKCPGATELKIMTIRRKNCGSKTQITQI